jgi:type I restriction enzyme S subunit
MSWSEAFLKDLADIQLGKMLDKKKNQGEYRPYLGNDNVQWGFVDTSQIKEMKFKSSELERFSLRHGDILVCEGGDPGRCALWLSDMPMCYQKALHRVRVYDRLDSRYLFHYLTYLGFTQEIRQYYTGGATIKHLPKAALSRVVIRYPEISIQKRIASILSAYDELIENNRKQIKLLEEAAQRLYKEWFIDLKFPGHETTPIDPETNLPEGWRKGILSDIAEFKRGKTITAAQAEKGTIPVVAGGLEPAYYHSKANAKGPVVTISASGANAGFTRLYTTDIWASDCSFLSADVSRVFLFVYESVKCIGRNFKHLQRGSAQPHVYPSHINSMEMLIPTVHYQVAFCETVKPFISQISILHRSIEDAKEARDRLLPKLMSGEIEVN